MTIKKNKDKFNLEEFTEEARENGLLLLIDKDPDWTSFDVCKKVRGLVKIKKVGHSGTLDPAATGLLVLGIGKGTKLINELTILDKIYSGIIKIGATTKTDDAEAEEENVKDVSHITEDDILEKVKELIGPLKQKPPRYSAKKIKGKRMYSMAAKGIEFEVKEYDVEVFRFDIKKIELPFIHFEIHCSKGTYIRSLARDLGEKLHVGGHLYRLRRETVGEYKVEDAFKIDEFEKLIRTEDA